MLKRIQLRSFRCFRKADLAGLRRINLVVGANGTGKTALLEAIFLASGGSPRLAVKLRLFRGMGQSVQGSPQAVAHVWEALATDFDLRDSVEIHLSGDQSRSLVIRAKGTAQARIPTSGAPASESVAPPIEFVWSADGSEQLSSRPRLMPDGNLVFEEAPTNLRTALFAANFSLPPDEASRNISAIRIAGRHDLLLETFRSVFPDITDVSPETDIGSWLIHVRVAGLRQMIPLALYSNAASRFIAYLGGIAEQQNGVVLIDEIENGFYYKALEKAWQALYVFAEAYETQLFITTHSLECLRAAKSVIAAHPDSFALVRANHQKEDRWLDCFSGERLSMALEQGFELR